MGQRCLLIGLVVWLAIGCSDDEPKPNAMDDGGGATSGGVGGGGSGGASGAGAGGAGAGGADAGGDGGALECALTRPDVFACVKGGGITAAGTGESHVELTGIVERRERDSFGCVGEDGSRSFGILGSEGQTYVIGDGAAEIELTVGTGSDRPLLSVGQHVRVAVDDTASGSMLQDSVVLSVRDDEDGRILFWFTWTELGFDGLALPPGFTASNAGPQCAFELDCGGVQYRRGLALLEGSDEVAIVVGELASIGGVDALLIDNTEQVLTGGSDACFGSGNYHDIGLALFDPDLIAKCDWRDEEACAADDECRAVRAKLVGYPEPRLIACVEDSSCSDGDAVTCAINDHTEQLAEFTTTCVPPGWTEAYGACGDDSDAGLPAEDAGAPGPDVDRSEQQLYAFEFSADEADVEASESLGDQLAELDTRVAPIGKLVVFLHGAGDSAPARCGSSAHGELLAGLGFHVFQPCYNSYYGVGNCGQDIGGCRLEAFEGVDHHAFIAIAPPDAIERRIVRGLMHLQAINPEGDWQFFLDGDQPRWSEIIISGISHGASSAGVIGMNRLVDRVVMLSGPLDSDQAWLEGEPMTPRERFWGFSHTGDDQHAGHLEAFETLGLIGDATSVDGMTPPYGGSHRLITSAATGDGHGSTQAGGSSPQEAGAYVFAPVWRQLYVAP